MPGRSLTGRAAVHRAFIPRFRFAQKWGCSAYYEIKYAEFEVQEAIDRIINDIVNKELDELHEKQKEAEEAYRKKMQKLNDEETKLVAMLRPVEGKTYQSDREHRKGVLFFLRQGHISGT